MRFVLIALALVACDPREEIKNELNEEVQSDVIKQYEIVKRNGDKMETCAHAGAVAMSFLQAHNEVEYQKWKKIQKSDCKRAGLPSD